MTGQGLKYNVDIVMCIDCTGSMGDLLDTVKNNALKFYPDLHARCDEKGKEISEFSYVNTANHSSYGNKQ